jgi:spindle assembly abnormal protein 6
MRCTDTDTYHGSTTFHAESVSVLYEKPVWFKVVRADREDAQEELIFRIATVLQKGSHHSKMLKMQITSEDDPFFLHSMEITEEDFQTLKLDQSILVDFGAFSNELIDLLEACVHARGEENPQFRAILKLDAGFSTFSVLEVSVPRQWSEWTLCVESRGSLNQLNGTIF